MKKEAKKWIDANVWGGEDRSGCKNDGALFNPDELQELIDELIDDLFTPKLEATERKLAEAENVVEAAKTVNSLNLYKESAILNADEWELIKLKEALSDYEASKG